MRGVCLLPDRSNEVEIQGACRHIHSACCYACHPLCLTAGAAVGGVLAAAAVVGGAWWGVKRRRSRAAYAAAPSAAPAQQRLPSIIPGVHQRFDAGDLTEVVEQTGSPSLSPRRRRAASFNGDSPADSPQLSPTKRVTRSSRGHAL